VVNQVPVYLAHTTYQRFEDKEVVLAAVTKQGDAWEYASEEMKQDPLVALVASATNGDAKKYLDPAMKSNKDLVLSAVNLNGYALDSASETRSSRTSRLTTPTLGARSPATQSSRTCSILAAAHWPHANSHRSRT